ncbi:acyltransferase [Actinoplanes cyaneus]|uniref:Acyltransferase n=1 Tax=Actinoplanes cyaneus TaxID=52696 RepID=A0A919M431_9ACTN|nr:acyltransferase [Actinoplanes cyaneus]GID63773.1 acyltransferase [Actinoplanes cyaneus]
MTESGLDVLTKTTTRLRRPPAPVAPPRRGPGDRVAVLDGLRLCAALSVAVFHFTAINADRLWAGHLPFTRLTQASSYGWLGVELFFMISGFVISMSAWGRTVGGFARSRLVRLFPAYWPAVLLTAAVVTLWPSLHRPVTAQQVVVSLTMLNEPLGVVPVDLSYWTLWAEARFYLLFAIVVWLGPTRRRVLWFGYAWLIASVVAVKSELPVLVTVLQPPYAPYFVAGIGFFLIHRFGSDLRHWGLVALSWGLGMYSLGARVAQTSRTEHRQLSLSVAMLIVTALFLMLTVVALRWTDRVRWRPLTTAGLLTYPFYLLHQHIGGTMIQHLHRLPPIVAVAAVIAIMLVVAWMLHRWIERPLARALRARLAADDAPAPPAQRGVSIPEPEWTASEPARGGRPG